MNRSDLAWPDQYGDPSWLVDARLGLFVHWGPMSASRCCWPQARMEMSRDEYTTRFVDRFDPDLYDPAAWADAAWAAGMRYVVLTTKHHDGFCLWDSALTDFKATNTPAGRDLLHPFVDAFRDRGFRIGFYHSLLDWHHPHFTVDVVHPDRDDPAVVAQKRDFAIYREYLFGQVRELLTGYGRVDYLWFDFSYANREWKAPSGEVVPGKGAADWHSVELEQLCLELQPDIILNDRLDLHRGITTPEQNLPEEPLRDADGRIVLWELCETHNTSWTYSRDDLRYKTPQQVVVELIDVVSKGGNLLFNVGPTVRGSLAPMSSSLLDDLAGWMRLHERSIRGAGPSSFTPPADCRYTQRGDRLYVHVLQWQQQLALPGLRDRVAYASTLHDGFEIRLEPHRLHEKFGITGDHLVFELPMRPDVLVPVIELELKP